jgi:hypothetical protein
MTKYHVVDDEHGNTLTDVDVKRMVEKLRRIDYNAFPDEVESDGVVYILSEIGGRENKLESGENLGVYIPKDFESCLKLGSLKLRSKEAKKLAV